MPDLWDEWERSVQATGRPDRLAERLSDEELVNFLAARPDANEPPNVARALKQEALRRLHQARRADRGGAGEDPLDSAG